MRAKTENLERDDYAFHVTALQIACMLADDYAGRPGAKAVAMEAGPVTGWDDILEILEDGRENRWQVKRKFTSFARTELIELLQALARSSVHRATLALPAFIDVEQVGPMRTYTRIHERAHRCSNASDLARLANDLYETEEPWVQLLRAALGKEATKVEALQLAARFRIMALGDVEHIRADAERHLAHVLGDPRAAIAEILSQLHTAPDGVLHHTSETLRKGWLAKFAERVPQSGNGQSPTPLLPSRAQVFVGRDAELAHLRERVLGPKCRVAVLGMAGVGKSTLSRQVLTDSEVEQYFGDRRMFVRASGITTADGLLAKVAAAIGVTGDLLRLAHMVMSRMAEAPLLLILDNFDSAWHRDPECVEELLSGWADIASLALVATIRGMTWPSAALHEPLRLEKLPLTKARELFLSYAPDYERAGGKLDELLEELDGVPLGLELLARQAQSVSLDVLRRAWASRRDGMISGWATALELSYSSPRMNVEAREVTGIVSELPGGVSHEDVEVVLGEEWTKGLMTATELGLVVDQEGRLHTHALVREYVRRQQPASDDGLARARKHYLRLTATLGPRVGRSGGVDAAARLTSEFRNIEFAVLEELAGEAAIEAIEAAIGLHSLGSATRVDVVRILETSAKRGSELGEIGRSATCVHRLGDMARMRSDYEQAHARFEQALRMFEAVGDRQGVASCCLGLGDLDVAGGRHERARTRYARALSLFEAVGDVHGHANCLQGLANIARLHSEHKQTCLLSEQALRIFEAVGDVVGQATCIRNLGAIAYARSEHEHARARYERALSMFRAVGDLYGQAVCVHCLGDIARMRGDYEQAQTLFEQALGMFRVIGDSLGQANCIQGLADVARLCQDYQQAYVRYEDACHSFEVIGDLHSQANCVQGLGDVAFARNDLELTHAHYVRALRMFDAVGDVQGRGNCIQGLGDVARARGKNDQARAHYKQSLEVFGSISDLYSAGRTLLSLSKLAQGRERADLRRRAREAWTTVGRHDLVSKYLSDDG